MANFRQFAYQRSARRSFRRILHPDMTPMVGLGFLLVTFFLLAADFTKTTVLPLSMPVKPKMDHEQSTLGPCVGAMTLILGENNKVHYYYGLLSVDVKPEMHTTSLTATGLRQVLLQEKAESGKFIVLIKSSDKAKYRNMVDVLDEMNITDMYRYALVDMAQGDYDLLRQHGL
ncbi:ExbD/TolR family protein [Hymenobacter metallicola]|uniref:Biopolymer transporter ExbD n=1 Tax=Hymenobacter metallicola TaxID=2563114 RepID=A0A4Z0QBS1_9BACT|nr:biopolymer transporter ExbD [Hymenobacter metallicola]TGE27538.1 biopolymer transporter ExbD [Hymenobacter metallicola]